MSYVHPKARGVFNPTNIVRNIPVVIFRNIVWHQIINVDLHNYLKSILPLSWFDVDQNVSLRREADLDTVTAAIEYFYNS